MSDRLKNPLCVALDSADPDANEELAAALGPHVGLLKVGLTAFAAGGPDLVMRVAKHAPVFLDLKLHDIPAQVAGAVTAARALGVDLVTVHALGGPDMIQAALDAAGSDVTIVAVTLLTSMDEHAASAVGLGDDIRAGVRRLAKMAAAAGVRALVCSPHEVAELRNELGRRDRGGPLLVVPGVRAAGSPAHDQKRTLPAPDAITAGADVVVVGRPITRAADPVAAARELLAALRAPA